MLSELSNTPSTFQVLTNDRLKLYLHKFVLVFLNDILMYSLLTEYLVHVAIVVEVLHTNQGWMNVK